MRHVRMLGLCLVAVLALSALTASAAWAKAKPDLVLLNEEAPAPVGSVAWGWFVLPAHGCIVVTEGTVTSNNSPSADAAAFSSPLADECEEGSGYSITGNVKTASASAKKSLLSFTANITLTTPAGCKYAITKYSVKFTPKGGEAAGEGEVAAKEVKPAPKTCAKKETFSILPFMGGEDTTFHTEIT